MNSNFRVNSEQADAYLHNTRASVFVVAVQTVKLFNGPIFPSMTTSDTRVSTNRVYMLAILLHDLSFIMLIK